MLYPGERSQMIQRTSDWVSRRVGLNVLEMSPVPSVPIGVEHTISEQWQGVDW
jgi:hypothetical protein